MATQLQAQQPDKLPQQKERHKWLSQRTIIILTVILIALIITIIWILSTLGTIPKTWATISSIIVTVLGVVFAFLQSSHLFIPPDKQEQQALSVPQTPPIIIQVPSTQPLSSPALNKTSYRVQAAHIYNNLGVVHRVLGHTEEALQYLEHALSICKKMGESGEREIGWVLNSLGRVYDDLGQKEQAQDYYEQALLIFGQLRDRQGRSIILNNLGRVYNELGAQRVYIGVSSGGSGHKQRDQKYSQRGTESSP